MKRTILTKAVCVLLSLTMILGTAACGQQDPPETESRSRPRKTQAAETEKDSGKETDAAPVYELERDTSVPLSPEHPVVEFTNGVKIDFSSDGLTAAEDLAVACSPVSGDGVMNTVTYSFSLGDGSVELPMLAEVTLPCEPGWNAEEAFVECYDDEAGEWVPVWSEADPETGSVTFWPEHFSEYRLCAWDEAFVAERFKTPAEKRSVYFYATAAPGPSDPVYFDSAAMKARVIKAMSGTKAKSAAQSKDYVGFGLDAIGNVTDAAGNYLSYVELLGDATYRTEELAKSLQKVGNTAAFVKIFYSFAKKGDLFGSLADNWEDLAKMIADYAVDKIGSAAVSNAAVLFWIVYKAQKMLGEQVQFAVRLGGSDEIDYAYRKFTMDYVALSPSSRQAAAFYDSDDPRPWRAEQKIRDIGGDWCRIVPSSTTLTEKVISIFVSSPGMQRSWSQVLSDLSEGVGVNDPDVLFERLTASIDSYCTVFWRLDPGMMTHYLKNQKTSDGRKTLSSVWKEPSEAEKKAYTEKLRSQIFAANLEVFKPLVEKAAVSMANRMYREAHDHAGLLNQKLTFTLKSAETESFADSFYAAADIRLRQFEFPGETMRFQEADGYRVTCTRYAWMLMARGGKQPKFVDVQPSGEEAVPFEFSFSDPDTVITITRPEEDNVILKSLSTPMYLLWDALVCVNNLKAEPGSGNQVTVENDRLTVDLVALSDAEQATLMTGLLDQNYGTRPALRFSGTVTEVETSYWETEYTGKLDVAPGSVFTGIYWRWVYDSYDQYEGDYYKMETHYRLVCTGGTFRIRIRDGITSLVIELEGELFMKREGDYESRGIRTERFELTTERPSL